MIQSLLLIAFVLGILLAVLWWLLIDTEGVYLGRRAVIWLYDLYAGRYDSIKDFEPEYEHALLAAPIMSEIAPHVSPLVLDVATGTGRLPLALLEHARFQGRVVGLDLSRRMLRQAADKLAENNARVDLLWAEADRLPFPSNSFDVVTCLEALEFMDDPAGVIREMARVLRPGGVLLLTNRIGTRRMPGRTFSNERFVEMLESSGLVNIAIEPWQEDYHRVWANKDGESLVCGARPLQEVLLCPRCGGYFDADWRCGQCGAVLETGEDGVLDYQALRQASGQKR